PALQAARIVQAHGSSHAFLVAAVLGVVAVIAAIGLIKVTKTDVAQAPELALAA
ncbi:MAG: hypothetical protein QOJ80_703, partial [Mycobacterium sp.]|nr:hypothetical protein [Mycobacterium sp.]